MCTIAVFVLVCYFVLVGSIVSCIITRIMSVFKRLKPRAQWANPLVPEHYEAYYFRFEFRKKPFLQTTDTTNKEEAKRIESRFRKQLKSERWEAALETMEGTKHKRRVVTIGMVIDAYKAVDIKLTAAKTMRRNASDLLLVVAYAQDLWVGYKGGRRWPVKVGDLVPDVARIRELPVSILDQKLVQDYQRARQALAEGRSEPSQKGEVKSLNLQDIEEGNLTINRTLMHARDVFSKAALANKLDKLGLCKVDDGFAPRLLRGLHEFRTARLLKEEAPEPDPLTTGQFAAVMQCSRCLRWLDEELWLCDLVLRQTGLRSAYVEGMRGSWLITEAGGIWLDVKNRPEEGFKLKPRTRAQKVPLSEDLALLLQARARKVGKDGFLLLPEGSPRARGRLVHGRHNEWLKARIGGLGELCQGNHRLRDTVASALCTLYGVAVAHAALGHTTPMTTMKHYAKLMPEVTALLRDELRAWARLTGAGQALEGGLRIVQHAVAA